MSNFKIQFHRIQFNDILNICINKNLRRLSHFYMGAPIGTLRIAHAVIIRDTKTKIVPGKAATFYV